MTTHSAPIAVPARGMMFYMIGIFCMASMDMVAKLLNEEVHVSQTVWTRYAGQTLIVLLIFAPNLRTVLKTKHPGTHFLRSLFLLGGTSLFFLSLTRLGLAEATAIMDINPVFLTLGAALFLGERFGARRAIGVAAAFAGALVIIRPGVEVFQPASVLPLIAAAFYAGFVLLTRKMGRNEDPRTSLFYAAALGAVLTSIVVPFYWTPLTPKIVMLMVAIGILASLGQLFLIKAVQHAEASAIAPFTYVGLLVATFWGALIFGEFPDTATWIGGAIIVGSGIYIWHRERVAR